MIKVGIIGTENSHATQFTHFFNKTKKYPEIQVTHIGGMYPEANAKLKELFPEVEIVENPSEMLGKVDAIMVTCRDGKYHFGFAKPFVEAGIPAFVDKPFTRDVKEAEELVKIAKEKGVPLCGGSAVKTCYDILMLKSKVDADPENVKGGTIIAPVSMVNDYGGYWFYSAHLAEMTLKVFGYNPVEVTAEVCNNNITVMTKYENFIVTNQFTNEGSSYFGQVINQYGVHSRDIDTSLIFNHECDEFANMLLTGKMEHSYEQQIMPVRYLVAVEESFKTGKTVKI